jgi:hypothetical protein
MQYERTIGGFGGPNSTNMFSNALQTITSWYEMWIDPSTVIIRSNYKQKMEHTAGSIVTYHFRKDVMRLQVSGKIGWVAIQSNIEQMQDATFQLLRGRTKPFVQAGKDLVTSLEQLNPLDRKGKTNRLNNSPRKFLERLRDLADQSTYYYDKDGMEHYNIKFIKMFTKQYPTGIICEGYFKTFDVPESSDDAQTVAYSFTFIVENTKPVTLLQRVAGMFSSVGSIAGDVASLV